MKMRVIRSTYILCALGASLALACGDDDDDENGADSGPAAIRALCEEGCATALTLSCPNEETVTCASDCDYTEEIPESCRAAARATLQCVADLPVSDWACDDEGQAAVQGEVCDAEFGALVACANDENGTCPFENDDECDDPTGTELCPAGTDLADCAQ